MARPTKKGLDYFPLDVDFFNDEKVEAISGEFGIKGEIVIIKLLSAIYRNGYFIEWSEMLQMKLLKNLPGIKKELLTEIVQRLVKWNFFNENLFNSENILTSQGIQKRYLEATKRRKNNEKLQYCLLKEVNVNINEVNVNISTQSKVKESKVKKRKEVVVVNSKEKTTTSPFDLGSFFDVDILYQELLNDKKRLTGIISNKENKFKDLNHLKEKLTLFLGEIKGGGILTKEGKDFCSHFRNWHKKKLRDNNTNQVSNHSKIPVAQ